MRYIKTFEIYDQDNEQIRKFIPDLGDNQIMTIQNIMDYLRVEILYPEDSIVIPVSKYDIDVIEYFKEIFMGKIIKFKSIDKPEKHPLVKGIVKDVDQLAYQDEFFIRVELTNENIDSKGNIVHGWFLINNEYDVWVYNYDADTKPLHKEVELKKEAEKYNL